MFYWDYTFVDYDGLKYLILDTYLAKSSSDWSTAAHERTKPFDCQEATTTHKLERNVDKHYIFEYVAKAK